MIKKYKQDIHETMYKAYFASFILKLYSIFNFLSKRVLKKLHLRVEAGNLRMKMLKFGKNINLHKCRVLVSIPDIPNG